MNQTIKGMLVATAALCTACANSSQTSTDTSTQSRPLSQQMVEAHGLGNFDCNRKHKDDLATTGWDYVSGLVANAVLMTWQQYPERTAYLDRVKAFADFSLSHDGTEIHKPNSSESALGESNLDDLAAGKIFFGLYDDAVARHDTADAIKYRTAATVLRNRLKYNHARIPEGRKGAGGFFHKAQYPYQMWLDGLYMGAALYAQWQHYFGESEGHGNNIEAWSDIARQFKIIHEFTYDADKQLNYHAWSASPNDANSFWARKDAPHKGCSPEFWARGMGWYFAALVDVLGYMPQDHADYGALRDILTQVAEGLKRWQDDETGLWYQLLQYDASKTGDGIGDRVGGETYNKGDVANYLESSASSMYAYAFLKAARLGLLNREEYIAVGRKAYDGLLIHLVDYDEDMLCIKNICASAGLGPAKDKSRTGTANYYLCGHDVVITSNEGKAIGPFIMASLEFEKLQQ